MRLHNWLKVLNSPFKLPKLKWYIGKIAVGLPYFYPRKWVKFTHEDAKEAANKALNDPKWVKKSFDEWYSYYMKCQKAVPLTIGFSSCDLGWKTKWTETDYRYEWSPIYSFVFFKWQIACWVYVEEPDHYWPAWLYYENNTDKTKSKKIRIQQCKEGFPNIWKVHDRNGTRTVDYYPLILKKKYL